MVLPWKPPPAADELVLAGVALREAQRALDRLGATGVHLQAVHAVRGRVLREPLEQLDARLARHRADRRARRLLLDRLDPRRMRVTERADRDAADEVEERVAVDVGDRGALCVVDDDAGHQRVALRARREVRVFALPQGLALRARDRGLEVTVLVRGLRHLWSASYRRERPMRTSRSTAAPLPITATASSATSWNVVNGRSGHTLWR